MRVSGRLRFASNGTVRASQRRLQCGDRIDPEKVVPVFTAVMWVAFGSGNSERTHLAVKSPDRR
jgi:hypothetical protein